MKSKYTIDGVNKETYKLLFDEKEEYKKECSKEIYTIDLSSCYNRNEQMLKKKNSKAEFSCLFY